MKKNSSQTIASGKSRIILLIEHKRVRYIANSVEHIFLQG